MPDTNVTGASQTQTSVNPQNVDTDESQKTSPLGSAHPNAKIVTALSSSGVNAPQQATREQVAATLADVVTGTLIRSAAQKADDLLNLLPKALRTPEALNNLQRVLKNEKKAVTDLLHSARDNYKTPALRMFFRAEILKKLAAGSTTAEAMEHANYLVARRNVINSMKDVLKGQVLGATALDKAKTIVGDIPKELNTVAGMRNIQDKLDNNRADVRELLHSVEPAFANRSHRMSLRTELVSHLAAGATIEEAQAYRDNIFARERFIIDFLESVVGRGNYETKWDAARAVYDQLPDALRTTNALQEILEYYNKYEADVDDAFIKLNDSLDANSSAYLPSCAAMVERIYQDASQAAVQARAAARPAPIEARPIIPTPVLAGDAFLDATQRGTPATPMILDYRGNDCRNTVATIGNGQGTHHDIQAAGCNVGQEASGAGYLFADRILRTNAIAVFWEARNGEQKATLFNNAARGRLPTPPSSPQASTASTPI